MTKEKPYDPKDLRGEQNQNLHKRKVIRLTKKQIDQTLRQRLWEAASKPGASVPAVLAAMKVLMKEDTKTPKKDYDQEMLERAKRAEG